MLLVAAAAPDRARTRAEIAAAVAAAMTDAEAITTRVLDHLARAAAGPGRPAEPALSACRRGRGRCWGWWRRGWTTPPSPAASG
ncbi:hypothetical protein ACFQY5_19305 [Paeniroseomonas aquatica]|uniref:hypothetical protein n=1 Tax=Paeniroseomonas aquatica TaxID=373043 RepID=UPI00360886E9